MSASRIPAALVLSSSLLSALLPRSSKAADWQIDAGAGVISAPRSLGSGRQLTVPVPVIEARYRDWFFATDNPIEGIGVAKKLESGLRLTASLGVDLDTRTPGRTRTFDRCQRSARRAPRAAGPNMKPSTGFRP